MSLFFARNRPDLGPISINAKVGVGRSDSMPGEVILMVDVPMGMIVIPMNVDTSRKIMRALGEAARDAQEGAPLDGEERVYL